MCSVAQLCPTLCDSWRGYDHGIFLARILEWVAISSSRVSSWPRDWAHVSCISCIADRFFTASLVQSLSRVQLFATPWIIARQASPSITNSLSSPKLTSIESVMPSSHLILCHPFSSCPQFLPASESFPMSQHFAWGGQSTGVLASESFLTKNTQDWSPLERTGWISLQSKGLSRVFSNTT